MSFVEVLPVVLVDARKLFGGGERSRTVPALEDLLLGDAALEALATPAERLVDGLG